MRFIIVSIGASVSILNLLVYCYFGHITTDCYLEMADYLFESNWYTRPLNYQKALILMIQNAQRKIQYHGSGVAYLNLNTYLQVCVFLKRWK